MSAVEGGGEGARHGLAELIDERRAKARRLAAEDETAFPYSFAGVEPAAGIVAAYEHLEPGQETDERHRAAGRIAARRGAGRTAFLDLVDRSGKLQLHARIDVLGAEAFERLTTLDLGDLIGVDGSAIRSRHGEVSLRVEGFQVLAKALRPPPDKHHGLADVETRYRHRELDLIASAEARTLFIDRARIISAISSAWKGRWPAPSAASCRSPSPRSSCLPSPCARHRTSTPVCAIPRRVTGNATST